MATLLVKVTTPDLDDAKSTILGQHTYLEFVRSFRSFKTLQFTCEEKDQSQIDAIRGMDIVAGATYDKEYHLQPVTEEGVQNVEFSGDTITEVSSEVDEVKNTRILTTSGGGTLYVKVQTFTAGDRFVISNTQGGSYSRISTYSGFLQGGTYTFDQSDSSNAGHPFRFSLTPDGTFGGGVAYTSDVTVNGTPGQSGAYTRITISATTPSVLYWYNANYERYGDYNDTPSRFGKLCVHDFWYLDRITKQNRSFMNGSYNTNEEGDGVDVYVLDTGIRGASRPTGNNAGLHPELYSYDNITDLNGLSEQQAYRVYEVTGYNSGYTVGSESNSNEDDNGHGTQCANIIGGIKTGLARQAKFYALKCFSSAGSGSLSGIMNAYQAVIDHNDSGNANYKGNTRPAVINASFGPTQPSGSFPYVELNEPGADSGFDVELYDETEKEVVDNNIILVRSAGNGFKNSSNDFLGPLQTRFVAGARSSGYSDGDVNTVDVNINSIVVGASDYNDRWADFSNYGSAVTTVAPGQHLTVPAYDWTANTPYTSTGNYVNISGTSFSGPVVAGIMTQWVANNNYNLGTSNLTQLSKNFIRQSGTVGTFSATSHEGYPINTAIEYKLPSNPFITTASSRDIKVKFEASDSSVFLNNIGKKIQLRLGTLQTTAASYSWDITGAPSSQHYTMNGTDRNGTTSSTDDPAIYINKGDTITFDNQLNAHPFYIKDTQGSSGTNNAYNTGVTNQGATFGDIIWDTTNVPVGTYYYQCSAHPNMEGAIYVQNADNSVGGVNLVDATAVWQDITAQDAANNTITFQVTNAATSTSSGGGGDNCYMCIISDTHEETDGPTYGSVALYAELDSEESTHSGRAIRQIPVDTGVDFQHLTYPSVKSKVRGAFTPFIPKTITWHRAAGDISSGGDGFDNGESVNLQLGINTVVSYANENFSGRSYSLSGSSLTGSGLTFSTSTGALTGTVTSSYNNTTYNITVTELTTGESQAYSFDTNGTGVLVNITGQPSDASIEAGTGNATFGPVTATTSDSSTVTFQWQFSTDGGSNWADISGLADHSGETTDTLTVVGNYGYNDYQYRCVCGSSTAPLDAVTNAVTLTVFRVIRISSQPSSQSVVAPSAATFTLVAAIVDGTVPNYQWSKADGSAPSTFGAISGATSPAYTTSATTYDSGDGILGTNFDNDDRLKCSLTAVGAAAVESTTVILTVTRTVTINTQPTDQTGSVGGTRTFTVAASLSDGDNSDVTFQWQQSIDDGTSWSNIGGATSADYTTPTLTASMDEYQYRVFVSAPGAANVISNAAVLQVETVQVSVTLDPTDQAADELGTATFTCNGTAQNSGITGAIHSSFGISSWITPQQGNQFDDPEQQRLFEQILSDHTPSVTFQWQRSDNQGGSWSDIGGATSSSYTTPALTYANDHDDRYRCKIDAVGADTEVYTGAALLTVYRTHTISTQPSNQIGNEGGTATFTVAGTTSSGTHTYQWEKAESTNVANYTPVSGATNASYTTPTLVYVDDNADRYRCVLSLVGAQSPLTSSYAELTVNRVITISVQPQNQTIIEGNRATYNITAAITSGTLNYQWQLSTDNGGNWNNINGATNPSYQTPNMPFPTVGRQYRCVLSNSNAISVTSDAATLTVNESEFVEAPTSMNVNVDTDTGLTFNRQPTATSSAFVSQYAGSTHAKSFWLIKRVSDNTVVYDTSTITVPDLSAGDPNNLTTFTVPAGTLDFDTTYSVQVKFKDQNDLTSNYSTPVQFTTPVVDQPEIQVITPAFNPTISVLSPSIKSGYGHVSSDWQFSRTNTFTDVEHQSLGNSTNLVSYTLPGDVTTLPTTTYYVRVRFNVDTI